MTLKKYHHLTQDQRYQLEELGSRGLTTRMIAKNIGVIASTVSREKARNLDKMANITICLRNNKAENGGRKQVQNDIKSKAN